MFFEYGDVHVERVALTASQIGSLRPPPNPAKTTDSRFKEYRNKHGDESWELDAVEPSMLVKLLNMYVKDLRDEDAWREAVKMEDELRQELRERIGL